MKKRITLVSLLFAVFWLWGFLKGYGEGQLDSAGSIGWPERRTWQK